MAETLHLVAVHVELYQAGVEVDYERFIDRVLTEITDDTAMWSIGNESIAGNAAGRELRLTKNLNDGPADLPRTVTLKEEMARFTFQIMGEHGYWLEFGEFDLILRETSNEDVFSPDVERFIKYAKEHTEQEPLDGYITFITVYEFHAISHYDSEGNKDVDHEWYFAGFLDDLKKLRTIVRQHAGDPCATCEGTGYKRESQTSLAHTLIMGKGEREKCETCKGEGVIPE